jgi:hypothetical protein
MAGLVPAIHDLLRPKKDVDARDEPGHDVVEDPDSIYFTSFTPVTFSRFL